ncbi:MAG TPA: UDP-3-O-(3-hydroxymyristoyl)glucosamine N-acyltransferase [Burkholderiaceae bacterium]|nr:UDP-3-O-(3-hydroxymyristoyl)glucosamine N-acyltransferase [Burkholderiaceae bacterium]
MSIQLGQIVEKLGGKLHGDAACEIKGLASLLAADQGHISFVSNQKYEQQLIATQAACVIVGPKLEAQAKARGACIVTEQPYVYFAKLTQLWSQTHHAQKFGFVHSTAVVDATAVIHPTAHIGALCVVEANAKVGANTVLQSHVHVGHDCVIGDNCLLHPGVVIGADGFGFAPDVELIAIDVGKKSGQHTKIREWIKIEQLGAVEIRNNVEIGANTCIDRGALDNTIIGEGVKLDNLIQIGHGTRIGQHTVVAASTAIAGSTEIGAYCTIGGAVSIAGHLCIADQVQISGASVVTHNIHKPGIYSGLYPLDEHKEWSKNAAALKQLATLRERIRELEKSLNIK